jgi:hypothetical protein
MKEEPNAKIRIDPSPAERPSPKSRRGVRPTLDFYSLKKPFGGKFSLDDGSARDLVIQRVQGL